MSTSTLIKPIPEETQTKRGWTVEVNGKVVPDVSSVRLSHPRFGELNYGLTPGGYDGLSFHEVGGGGAVTVPYVIINEELYIGLVEQYRHNQGGKIWNLPRGFLDPGENHFGAAIRETKEETGFTFSVPKRLKELAAWPGNPNSAFFETPTKDEGVRFYALQILPDEVEETTEAGITTFRFKPGLLKPASKQAEIISRCEFAHWTETMKLGDLFTRAGVGTLLSELSISSGRVCPYGM